MIAKQSPESRAEIRAKKAHVAFRVNMGNRRGATTIETRLYQLVKIVQGVEKLSHISLAPQCEPANARVACSNLAMQFPLQVQK